MRLTIKYIQQRINHTGYRIVRNKGSYSYENFHEYRLYVSDKKLEGFNNLYSLYIYAVRRYHQYW